MKNIVEVETYFCEQCRTEFSILSTESNEKKGSICPNSCPRNHQIYLGVTPEEIKKRKEKFINTKNEENIETDIEVDNSLEEYFNENKKNYSKKSYGDDLD